MITEIGERSELVSVRCKAGWETRHDVPKVKATGCASCWNGVVRGEVTVAIRIGA